MDQISLILGTDLCLFAQQSEKVSIKGQDWGSSRHLPAGKVLGALCRLSIRIWSQSPFPLLLSQASLPSVLCGRGIPSPANHLPILPPGSGAGVLGFLSGSSETKKQEVLLYILEPGEKEAAVSDKCL